MGIPHTEKKGEKWKGERSGCRGVFRVEVDLDSEQNTRTGGMNINNIPS